MRFMKKGNEPDLSDFLNFIKDNHLKKIVAEIGMLSVNDEISDKELQDYLKHRFEST